MHTSFIAETSGTRCVACVAVIVLCIHCRLMFGTLQLKEAFESRRLAVQPESETDDSDDDWYDD